MVFLVSVRCVVDAIFGEFFRSSSFLGLLVVLKFQEFLFVV